MKFSELFKPKPNVKYILDGDRPVAEPDLEKWAFWFEKANQQLRRTRW